MPTHLLEDRRREMQRCDAETRRWEAMLLLDSVHYVCVGWEVTKVWSFCLRAGLPLHVHTRGLSS